MRKYVLILTFLSIVSIIFLFGGCAAMVLTSPAYPAGVLYTEIYGPITATCNTDYSKTGTAELVSLMGILAFGDASIRAAMKNGDITEIHHIDYKVTNVLGIYAKYTLIVYGN